MDIPDLRDPALSRRQFAATAALGLLGVLAPGWLRGDEPSPSPAAPARRPTASAIIYLYMSGGMSHLDTLDPKPGTKEAGPVQAIASSADGIQLSQYLPLLARQMHRCALLRSLSSNQGAHEQGNYFMHTSYLLRGTVKHPALGAWMLNFAGRRNPTLPGNIVIGGGSTYPGAGYLDPACAPLALGKASDGLQHSRPPAGVDAGEYQQRLDLLGGLNRRYLLQHADSRVLAHQDAYDQALALMKSQDLKAFDLAEEPARLRSAYGDTPFGQGCLLARRLVEHGVGYVEVDLGGWDTHTDNFERVADNCLVLDRALSTLLVDLASRGMLDQTLVVLASEFGRSPEITDKDGRNHHPKVFTGLLAGGGVRGGRVWGASDERGENVAENKVDVPDFNATIAYAAGLPLDTVVHSPAGRPFTLADKGRPVLGLFA